MKNLLILTTVLTSLFLLGCSADKNMQDFQKEQLQQNIARINSVAGTYAGFLTSKIDQKNLGGFSLKFEAMTDVASNSGQTTSEQKVKVSGTLKVESFMAAELIFDNGYYDSDTGNFQVTINVDIDANTKSIISLVGTISGDTFVGKIEVTGQPKFGGNLNLVKNATMPSTTSIEVGGTRLQQIKKTYSVYNGFYNDGTGVTPVKMTFSIEDAKANQKFYRLLSPVTNIYINLDFSDFELNYSNASLDDNLGTITGVNPLDRNKRDAKVNLNCNQFEDPKNNEYGYDCELRFTKSVLNIHFTAAKK
jgi:hypothetical protein